MSALPRALACPLPTPRRDQRGLSLVELMVSLAIGLILLAAIGYAYLASRQTFRTQEMLSRLQEGARYAFEAMASDIRMAGFTGCSASTKVNVLNGDATLDVYDNLFSQPLRGYENSAPTGVSRLRGDALVVAWANNQREYILASHNPSSAQFQLTANHDLKQGEILVVTDCAHAAVFQQTNVNNNDTIQVIVHNTGVSSPGNCTKALGQPRTCGNANCGGASPDPNCYTFPPGSRLLRLSGIAWYIGANPGNEPALYRKRLTHDSGNATTTAEEMVEGVEDMQIRYGVDGSSPADNAADGYCRADEIENASCAVAIPGASAQERWQRVLSARVALLMVSRADEGVTTAPQTYTYDGQTTTPTDRRLRKVFTTVIAVRNRL